MAHASRLSALCIDCRTDEIGSALEFWRAAFGVEGTIQPNGRFAELATDPSQPKMFLQSVDHDPRVHLDIETDDRDAEAKRLENLGAQVLRRNEHLIVTEAPTGHRFCIVAPKRADFDAHATRHGGEASQ
ncbi:MAG: VOC family protein [Pseudomonadota bacterium]